MNSQIADVLHDNRLSIEARMLYAYLCSFDDGAPPSTCQIIRQLGIGKTRFYRYRNELEAFGLIEVENTITSGGGVAKYSFPDKPVPTAEAEEILINRLINNNNKAMNFKKETPKGKCVFMNETMKPSCGEAYDATPIAVLAASQWLCLSFRVYVESIFTDELYDIFKIHVQAKCGDVNTSTGNRIWFSKYKDNYLHFWVSNLGIAGSCQKTDWEDNKYFAFSNENLGGGNRWWWSITGWSDLGYDSPTYLYKRNNGLQDASFGLGVYVYNTRGFPIKPNSPNLPAARSPNLNNVNRESRSRPKSRQNDQRT